MKIQTHEEAITNAPKRIAIYGDPKVGKTRLATGLPWGTGNWGDRAVYVAWDPGASELSSVLPGDREHLTVVTPTTDGKGNMDPLAEAVAIATANWEGHKTIIWDTMTYTATDLLAAISQLGLYGNNISLGKRGTNTYMAQPQMGDFGATQKSVQHILRFLFNQPLNVIVLFHSILADAESGSGETLGGPATVGKAGIRPVAGLFDNLFRVANKRVKVGTGLPPQYIKKRVVQTEAEGAWLAGLRSGHAKNPIAEYELGEDVVKFWTQLDAEMKGSNR